MKKIALLAMVALILGLAGTTGIIWSKDAGTLTIDHMANKQGPVEVNMDTHKAAGITCDKCHHAANAEKKMEDATGKACKTCHYKTGEEVPAIPKMVYHITCTGCHKDLEKEGKKSGPTKCAECHKKK